MIATFVRLGGINALAYGILAARIRKAVTRPDVLVWMHRAGSAILICLAAFTTTLRRI